MLIRAAQLGGCLAESFSDCDKAQNLRFVAHGAVLMRGHCFTAMAENIRAVVMTAFYTQRKATSQTAGMTAHLAYGSGDRDIS